MQVGKYVCFTCLLQRDLRYWYFIVLIFLSSRGTKCLGYCAALYRRVSNVTLYNLSNSFATPYSSSILSRTDEAPNSENVELSHYMRYITEQEVH